MKLPVLAKSFCVSYMHRERIYIMSKQGYLGKSDVIRYMKSINNTNCTRKSTII